MTKDEKGAVFDVPEEHLQLFKDFIEVSELGGYDV